MFVVIPLKQMTEALTYILPNTKGNDFNVGQLHLALLQIPVTAEEQTHFVPDLFPL